MPIQLLDDAAEIDVKDSDLGMPDGDEDTTYTLRVLSPHVYRKITKDCMRPVPTGGRGMGKELNVEKFSDAIWDYVLKGWNHGAVLWRGQPVDAETEVTLSDGTVLRAKYLIDGPRKTALLDKAGMNSVVPSTEDKEHSFRSPA